MSDVTLLTFPEDTDPSGDDWIYTVKNLAGIDRDKKVKLSRITTSYLEDDSSSFSIDLENYGSDLIIYANDSGIQTLTLSNSLPAGKTLKIIKSRTFSNFLDVTPIGRVDYYYEGISDGTSLKNVSAAGQVRLSFSGGTKGQLFNVLNSVDFPIKALIKVTGGMYKNSQDCIIYGLEKSSATSFQLAFYNITTHTDAGLGLVATDGDGTASDITELGLLV